jgi:hypothetical protein
MLLALAFVLAPACSSEDGTRLTPPSDAQTRLNELRTKPKFVADTLYPGAATETDRVEAEKVINKLIARLAVVISQTPTRERVLAEIERTLPSLSAFDSEGRDQALVYIEAAMDAVGLESSEGLLNRWRYGFDPSQSTGGNGG